MHHFALKEITDTEEVECPASLAVGIRKLQPVGDLGRMGRFVGFPTRLVVIGESMKDFAVAFDAHPNHFARFHPATAVPKLVLATEEVPDQAADNRDSTAQGTRQD